MCEFYLSVFRPEIFWPWRTSLSRSCFTPHKCTFTSMSGIIFPWTFCFVLFSCWICKIDCSLLGKMLSSTLSIPKLHAAALLLELRPLRPLSLCTIACLLFSLLSTCLGSYFGKNFTGVASEILRWHIVIDKSLFLWLL